MTTVAVTRNEISADKRATHGGGHTFKIKTKLARFDAGNPMYKTGFTVGYAGSLGDCVDILDWLSNPSDRVPRVKSAEFVVLTDDKKIFTFYNNPTRWMKVEQPYYSIGSGSQIALGALAKGATATEAVKIAAKFDPSTGDVVDTIKIE